MEKLHKAEVYLGDTQPKLYYDEFTVEADPNQTYCKHEHFVKERGTNEHLEVTFKDNHPIIYFEDGSDIEVRLKNNSAIRAYVRLNLSGKTIQRGFGQKYMKLNANDELIVRLKLNEGKTNDIKDVDTLYKFNLLEVEWYQEDFPESAPFDFNKWGDWNRGVPYWKTEIRDPMPWETTEITCDSSDSKVQFSTSTLNSFYDSNDGRTPCSFPPQSESINSVLEYNDTLKKIRTDAFRFLPRPAENVKLVRKYCTNCGKKLNKKWNFCPSCGEEI